LNTNPFTVDTYIARTANNSSDKAIIIFSDVFGIYKNAQLVADGFAKRGYLTVLPDLFGGDAISVEAFEGGKVNLPEWLAKHPTSKLDAIAESLVKHLRTTLGVKHLASVGYCFGAKYVVRNLKSGILDAGYTAHPSFVTAEELGAITQPLSIAASEIDEIFTQELRFESEKILAGLHVPYQINLYGAVAHGFAVRGDLSNKKVKFATDQAFEQAVSWFEAWL